VRGRADSLQPSHTVCVAREAVINAKQTDGPFKGRGIDRRPFAPHPFGGAGREDIVAHVPCNEGDRDWVRRYDAPATAFAATRWRDMDDLGDIPHAIQLALAPVFLLTGIAGVLNVLAGRLARIIDRGRDLTERHAIRDFLSGDALETELRSLERRRHLASSAITACTFSALLVCMVIGGLFFEAMLHLELKWVFGILFTLSTVALVIGLGYFLTEVHLATRTVRIGRGHAPRTAAADEAARAPTSDAAP